MCAALTWVFEPLGKPVAYGGITGITREDCTHRKYAFELHLSNHSSCKNQAMTLTVTAISEQKVHDMQWGAVSQGYFTAHPSCPKHHHLHLLAMRTLKEGVCAEWIASQLSHTQGRECTYCNVHDLSKTAKGLRIVQILIFRETLLEHISLHNSEPRTKGVEQQRPRTFKVLLRCFLRCNHTHTAALLEGRSMCRVQMNPPEAHLRRPRLDGQIIPGLHRLNVGQRVSSEVNTL
jgi:hypothetical protein